MAALTFLAIGLGGFFGTVLRYRLSTWMTRASQSASFPWGTFVVNMSGAFGFGVILSLSSDFIPLFWVDVLLSGFFGAYTTFSTFALDIVTRMEKRKTRIALFYAFSSLVLGFLGLIIGLWVGSIIYTCS
ncbi:MAG: fluoride efflux transporter CrcB [Candidatus Carbobacillus sp.]|nr:fluoride efflux transporter CrcB [Candidatus Carbobacillus sp.]